MALRFLVRTIMLCGSVWAAFGALPNLGQTLAADKAAHTGPDTEKRFPALKVPPGFKATLFACDPLIEYPSAIALGPKPGSLFVAADYLTGLGYDIVRRDEIRLIEDTDGDGYADKATVFATGFNSIQGIAYHDGTVYVMHAPLLTALRDTDGDGKADERRDLLNGLGLSPEKNSTRLHCANGVVVGHDGWLYLALGDHGVDIKRPEGDRLVLHGGGILRCRPDGHDLHVFATGLRNIYDLALDDELNVFVRDNENDGGEYKVRVCHSFFGADHGYPYLYYERPDEALPPLADLGLGSSAGGVCYLERQFPEEYRGNLFFCEWGRSVVRYAPRRSGSGFAPVKEFEFASGADGDPYGFKPTDLVVERDGSLIVSDWCDDQRPRRGRGRIYRFTFPNSRTHATKPQPLGASLEHAVASLDSDSFYERIQAQGIIEKRGPEGLATLTHVLGKGRVGVRGRSHAVWILARIKQAGARDQLLAWASSDPERAVQVQSIRALADLADPVFIRHRLDAGPGDAAFAVKLAALATSKEPQVVREAILALTRLRWSGTPELLQKTLTNPDPALAHAAMQARRHAGNWPAVMGWLDLPISEPLRAIALRALAGQYEPVVVDGLIDRLHGEANPARRQVYADLLTRVYQKPGPWTYWGYRPPPRPANTVSWERTDAISQALDRLLANADHAVGLAVLRSMRQEKVPARLPTLEAWLREEREMERIAILLESLRDHPAEPVRALLEAIVAERKDPVAGRLAALTHLAARLDGATEVRLLTLATSLEDGAVLAEVLHEIAKRPALNGTALLRTKLVSPDAAVRAAAITGLPNLEPATLDKMLADHQAVVREAAAAAAGRQGEKNAILTLLKLAVDPDSRVRQASFNSLRRLKEPRCVALAVPALADPETQLAALGCIVDLGSLAQANAVADFARRNPSTEVLPQVLAAMTRWSNQPGTVPTELDRLVAELQGDSGSLARWHASSLLSPDVASRLIEQVAPAGTVAKKAESEAGWQTVFATGADARTHLGPASKTAATGVRLAYTDLMLAEPTSVQFRGASNGAWRAWVNGRPAYQRDQARPFRADSDSFDAVLAKGMTRIVVQVLLAKGDAEFQLRFRRKSTRAEHERLAQAALTRSGNAERGRKLFLNIEKSQCLKCHRLGDQGERVGPDLTGIANRFARIHIIESILEPNRTVAPGFQTLAVGLKNGRVVTGLKIAETANSLTLMDNQVKKQVLAKPEIDEIRPVPTSTMPEGLEKQFTVDEFVDLIAFLVSQKEGRAR